MISLLFSLLIQSHAAVVAAIGPVDALSHPEFDLYDFNGLQRGTSTNPMYFGRTWSLLSSTDSVGAVEQGTWNITNITGTVSLPTGASTSALQTSGNNYLSQIASNTASALNDTIQSGSITTACTTPANCASTSNVTVNAQGAYTISASVTGTWAGSLIAEAQLADNSWTIIPYALQSVNGVANNSPYPSYNGTWTTNSILLITGGGYSAVRIRAVTLTSGTVSVALDASIAQQTTYSQQLGNWSVYQSGNWTFPQLPSSLGPKSAANALAITTASYSSKVLTSNATTTLKTGAGVVHAVIIGSNQTGGTINIYDNTAASGTLLFSATAGTPSGGLLSTTGQPGPTALQLDVTYSTALTVLTAGSTSNSFTVVYY